VSKKTPSKLLFFENSTAALMLVKRKSDDVASLRIAAVVLGGLARTSPHDDENKTGSVMDRGDNIQVGR
jgi:hypothetical protein